MKKKNLRIILQTLPRRSATAFVFGSLVLALSGCAFPRKDFSGVPDPGVIRLTQHNGQWRAESPDCQALLQPSQYNNSDNMRLSIAFGCATYTNLAASVARPGDLANPPEFAGTHSDTARLAVERYRLNDVEPLRDVTSTSDIGK
ncbi:CpaD family pilus assembly lipoprotein [Pusillimonas sp.]|uniref:CpaD family pilus assembly lipoprotein n=1 Tax=Pusillimonas sp. TaxID=3040095 RepID=UPI0037CB7E64